VSTLFSLTVDISYASNARYRFMINAPCPRIARRERFHARAEPGIPVSQNRISTWPTLYRDAIAKFYISLRVANAGNITELLSKNEPNKSQNCE